MFYQYLTYIIVLLVVWGVGAWIVWSVNQNNVDGFEVDDDDETIDCNSGDRKR